MFSRRVSVFFEYYLVCRIFTRFHAPQTICKAPVHPPAPGEYRAAALPSPNAYLLKWVISRRASHCVRAYFSRQYSVPRGFSGLGITVLVQLGSQTSLKPPVLELPTVFTAFPLVSKEPLFSCGRARCLGRGVRRVRRERERNKSCPFCFWVGELSLQSGNGACVMKKILQIQWAILQGTTIVP